MLASLWNKLVWYEGVVRLPASDLEWPVLRDKLSAKIVGQLKHNGASNIRATGDAIDFENGCFTFPWWPTETVTGGKIRLIEQKTERGLWFRVNFRRQMIRANAAVAFVSLILPVPVIILGLWFLPWVFLTAAVWWCAMVLGNSCWLRSRVYRFMQTLAETKIEPEKKKH